MTVYPLLWMLKNVLRQQKHHTDTSMIHKSLVELMHEEVRTVWETCPRALREYAMRQVFLKPKRVCGVEFPPSTCRIETTPFVRANRTSASNTPPPVVPSPKRCTSRLSPYRAICGGTGSLVRYHFESTLEREQNHLLQIWNF